MYMAPSQAYVGYQDPPLETAQEAPTIVAEGGPSWAQWMWQQRQSVVAVWCWFQDHVDLHPVSLCPMHLHPCRSQHIYFSVFLSSRSRVSLQMLCQNNLTSNLAESRYPRYVCVLNGYGELAAWRLTQTKQTKRIVRVPRLCYGNELNLTRLVKSRTCVWSWTRLLLKQGRSDTLMTESFALSLLVYPHFLCTTFAASWLFIPWKGSGWGVMSRSYFTSCPFDNTEVRQNLKKTK